jgi:hypothetical protein
MPNSQETTDTAVYVAKTLERASEVYLKVYPAFGLLGEEDAEAERKLAQRARGLSAVYAEHLANALRLIDLGQVEIIGRPLPPPAAVVKALRDLQRSYALLAEIEDSLDEALRLPLVPSAQISASLDKPESREWMTAAIAAYPPYSDPAKDGSTRPKRLLAGRVTVLVLVNAAWMWFLISAGRSLWYFLSLVTFNYFIFGGLIAEVAAPLVRLGGIARKARGARRRAVGLKTMALAVARRKRSKRPLEVRVLGLFMTVALIGPLLASGSASPYWIGGLLLLYIFILPDVISDVAGPLRLEGGLLPRIVKATWWGLATVALVVLRYVWVFAFFILLTRRSMLGLANWHWSTVAFWALFFFVWMYASAAVDRYVKRRRAAADTA